MLWSCSMLRGVVTARLLNQSSPVLLSSLQMIRKLHLLLWTAHSTSLCVPNMRCQATRLSSTSILERKTSGIYMGGRTEGDFVEFMTNPIVHSMTNCSLCKLVCCGHQSVRMWFCDKMPRRYPSKCAGLTPRAFFLASSNRAYVNSCSARLQLYAVK